MTTDAPYYFRLHPYVFLVNGAARSALYDLHRRRIFPIPSSAAYVLDRCAEGTVSTMLEGIENPDDRAMAQEYLDQLEAMDFGRLRDDVSTLVPFKHAIAEHEWTRIAFLSIDLRREDAGRSAAPNWPGLLRVARETYWCGQLTVFVSGEPDGELYETAVVEAATELQFHHIEIVFPEASVSAQWETLAKRLALRIALNVKADPRNATYRRLQEAELNVRFSETGSPTPISARMLVCDHYSFRRLRNTSVHWGSLHVNSRGEVFPWALEEKHLIGTVTDGASLQRLMASAELRRIWSFNKDSIDQCRQCEFRYACPHSYTFRRNPAVVGSAPANCGYDPFAGEWLTGGTEGLFERAPESERIEEKSEYFDIVSHASNPMPAGYAQVLDEIVERALQVLEIPRPPGRVTYFYYPSRSDLQNEVLLRDGFHVSGLTEYDMDGDLKKVTIRTAFPGHAHEVLHALLLGVRPDPRFFVSEACATILGTCWGTQEDVRNPVFALQGDIRVSTADDKDLDTENCLVYDDKGLLIGALRHQQSVHATARHLIRSPGVKPCLHSWFDAVDESGLPRYFYELGGSFFLWLIETRCTRVFLDFYRSKQTLRHLEGYYGKDISTLTREWLDFLTETR
jgi:radical SAM protein with 4Fe4S-binding SPASM domain